MKSYLAILLRFLPLVLLVAGALVGFFISPTLLIESVAVGNIYLFVFVFALLSGLSTISSIPYYVILVTFATGGVNPWLLGSVAALGVTLGDCATYLLGYLGHRMFTGRAASVLERGKGWLIQHPRLAPVYIFLYAALIPYSNDVVMIPAGFARYPLWRVALPLFFGTLVFTTGLALLTFHAYRIVIPFV